MRSLKHLEGSRVHETPRPLPVVIGAGWLGTAIAKLVGVSAVARRSLTPGTIAAGAPVIVASGRSTVAGCDGIARPLAAELAHIRATLDACREARASRIVILGSSDVAGLAATIDGQSPQAPRSPYAAIKAAVEDECVLRRSQGQNVVVARLAPVHGPGKARTQSLCAIARWPVIPLPNGGRHSVGFIFLDDAVAAVTWLLHNDASAVVSVGSGPVPLRDLLYALAHGQGRALKIVAMPGVPRLAVRGGHTYSDNGEWLLRLSLPRAVAMEVPVPITPLPVVAQRLVAAC